MSAREICLPDAVTARDASRQDPQGTVDAEVRRRVSAALQKMFEADSEVWDDEGMILFRKVFNDLGVELVQELENMIEIVHGGHKESEENQAEVVGGGGGGEADGQGLLDLAMIEPTLEFPLTWIAFFLFHSIWNQRDKGRVCAAKLEQS